MYFQLDGGSSVRLHISSSSSQGRGGELSSHSGWLDCTRTVLLSMFSMWMSLSAAIVERVKRKALLHLPLSSGVKQALSRDLRYASFNSRMQ